MVQKNSSNFSFENLAQMVSFIESNPNPTLLNFLEKDQPRKWVSFSNEDFAINVKNLSAGLKEIGIKKGDTVANLSYSSPIWLMMDFAIIALGAVSVPIFTDIALENLIFELNNAAVKFVFCDDKIHLDSLIATKKSFNKIIIRGFASDDSKVITFANLLEIGKKVNEENPDFFTSLIAQIKEDDLATIIYTSGSTGVPKGVEITHKNLVSQIKAAGQLFPFTNKDVALTFLPLAHVFERMIACYYLASGISIYFADDVKNLGDLLKEIKPTTLTVVPRMLEKVYAKIKSGVEESSFVKKIIGKAAIGFALNSDPFKLSLRRKIFDILVYKKLRALLGGNLQLMICGGAPLSADLDRFFKNIGINLFVGYGATETSPVIAVNYKNFDRIGTVGKAFPQVIVKVANDGELLIKGPGVMRGYHLDEVKTKETFDNDGWFKTGDLAQIDQDGFIKIVGRKKELFKTAGGKYVSPVPIEQKIVAACGFLIGACVIAEGRKFTTCILLPDFEILAKYKAKNGFTNLSDEEFLNSNFLSKKIEAAISSVNSGLNHWEQIGKYYLAHDPVSVETGELTPSMKLKRAVIEKKYKAQIDQFYQ